MADAPIDESMTPEQAALMRLNVREKVAIANERYLREHPEINVILRHLCSRAVLERPEEPVLWAERKLGQEWDLPALAAQLLAEEAMAREMLEK